MTGRSSPTREHSSAGARPTRPLVMFLSGEPDTPGHVYRVLRCAEAVAACGLEVGIVRLDQAAGRLEMFGRASLLVIWRAAWNETVASVVAAAREAGAPVLFDIDALLFAPELARPAVIDAIRSLGYDEAGVQAYTQALRRTLMSADFGGASTEPLAVRMRGLGKPAFVLPNGYDDDVLARSRIAARRAKGSRDGLVRLGYAGGSRTHQRDFAEAAEAVAEMLRSHPRTRLVLFARQGQPLLDLGEFRAFDGLQGQVEWREAVPLQRLPDELARFDINLAPVEVGNPYCEAKSELKFFEAALVDVPTVASPTAPFRRAIRNGETGLLAGAPTEWKRALDDLIADAGRRSEMAARARFEVEAAYGPERRAADMMSILDQVLARGHRAARAFERSLIVASRPRPAPPERMAHKVLFSADRLIASQVTVVVPLHNYAEYVEEALDSAAAQSLDGLDLIVVDDASTDRSCEVALQWVDAHADRFNRVLLVQMSVNRGLAHTRNLGFWLADTPFVLPLDADNRLERDCAARLLQRLRGSGAAFAYPQLRLFGDREGLQGRPYDPARLQGGNFIDAMALVRRSAWASVGGYGDIALGWEDYDFWCRLAEIGHFGVHVAEPLAAYRVHAGSMSRTRSHLPENRSRLIAELAKRHPWLSIGAIDAQDG